jgi:hypothetical protein
MDNEKETRKCEFRLNIQFLQGVFEEKKRNTLWTERFKRKEDKTESPFVMEDKDGHRAGNLGIYPSRMTDGYTDAVFYWDFIPFGLEWSREYEYAPIFSHIDSRRARDVDFICPDFHSFNCENCTVGFRMNNDTWMGNQMFFEIYGTYVDQSNHIRSWTTSMSAVRDHGNVYYKKKLVKGIVDEKTGLEISPSRMSLEGFSLRVSNTHLHPSFFWDRYAESAQGFFELDAVYTKVRKSRMQTRHPRLSNIADISFSFCIPDPISAEEELSRMKRKRELEVQNRKRLCVHYGDFLM